MSELIDREYAIKRFCEDGTYLERHGVQMMTLCEAKQRAVDLIESFPSAQPVNYGSTKTDSSSQLKLNIDLISRQDVLNELDGCDYELKDWQRWKLKTMVRDITSAQPQRNGRWIYGNDFHWYTASCNKCGYTRKTDIKATRWNEWRFCPNCGVRMDGESDE